MVKVLLATLVLLGSCFYSIAALPSPPVQGLEADPDEHLVKRIKFGTGLGHKKQKTDKFIKDLNNAFNKIYGDNSNYESNKRTFKFGTALGHNSKGNNDKYIESQNAMYNKLFGKRDSLTQDDKDLPNNDSPISSDDYDNLKRGVAFGTALGYNKKKNKYITDLNKAFKTIYGDTGGR